MKRPNFHNKWYIESNTQKKEDQTSILSDEVNQGKSDLAVPKTQPMPPSEHMYSAGSPSDCNSPVPRNSTFFFSIFLFDTSLPLGENILGSNLGISKIPEWWLGYDGDTVS